jgi:type I restriction enzyme R subunit
VLADIVSLVRFAINQDEELMPFAERVRERFDAWLSAQEAQDRNFTPDQRWWLEAVRDYIAGSVSIGMEDLQLAPFAQQGGMGRAHQVFGDRLPALLDELNLELAA